MTAFAFQKSGKRNSRLQSILIHFGRVINIFRQCYYHGKTDLLLLSFFFIWPDVQNHRLPDKGKINVTTWRIAIAVYHLLLYTFRQADNKGHRYIRSSGERRHWHNRFCRGWRNESESHYWLLHDGTGNQCFPVATYGRDGPARPFENRLTWSQNLIRPWWLQSLSYAQPPRRSSDRFLRCDQTCAPYRTGGI